MFSIVPPPNLLMEARTSTKDRPGRPFPFDVTKFILFSFLRMRQKITRYGAYFTKWHFKGMPGIFGGHDRNGGRGTALRFTDIRRGVAK